MEIDLCQKNPGEIIYLNFAKLVDDIPLYRIEAPVYCIERYCSTQLCSEFNDQQNEPFEPRKTGNKTFAANLPSHSHRHTLKGHTSTQNLLPPQKKKLKPQLFGRVFLAAKVIVNLVAHFRHGGCLVAPLRTPAYHHPCSPFFVRSFWILTGRNRW